MAHLIPQIRRNDILTYLQKNQFMRNSALSDLLNVSEATIRRDLEALENEGVIERTHGGAILSQHMPEEPAFEFSNAAHAQEKEWIGAKAASLIESGDTIFMNFGTTNAAIAKSIKKRVDLENLTILTNNLNVFLELQDMPGITLTLIGGTYRLRSHSLVGMLTLRCLEEVYANKAFIGVDGISFKYGCTTPVDTDAEISQKMIAHTSGMVSVVADSSKWGVVSRYRVLPINRMSALITDAGISTEAVNAVTANGVDVLIAG